MRITPTDSARLEALKRKSKTGTAGTGFASLLEGAGDADGASAPLTAHGINGLVALQEWNGGGQQQAPRDHAAALLAALDKLRLGLLTGTLPLSQLQNLARITPQLLAQTSDPRLRELLQDIDLRVQVELAKYGQSA